MNLGLALISAFAIVIASAIPQAFSFFTSRRVSAENHAQERLERQRTVVGNLVFHADAVEHLTIKVLEVMPDKKVCLDRCEAWQNGLDEMKRAITPVMIEPDCEEVCERAGIFMSTAMQAVEYAIDSQTGYTEESLQEAMELSGKVTDDFFEIVTAARTLFDFA